MRTDATSQPLYRVVPTHRYEKNVRKLKKSHFNLSKLDEVIDALARGEKLDEKYRDHALRGFLHGRRECHIGPDWLLMYRIDDQQLVLLLFRTGTHRDVLGIE